MGGVAFCHTHCALVSHKSSLRSDLFAFSDPGLLDKRFVVAKKKTKQLIDLTALWRRSVLECLDRQVLVQSTLDSFVVGRRSKSPDPFLQGYNITRGGG